MRALERRNFLRGYPNLQVSLPELPKGHRHCADKTYGRKPVDSPNQCKHPYHRKEREEDSDGGIARYFQIRERAGQFTATDALLFHVPVGVGSLNIRQPG